MKLISLSVLCLSLLVFHTNFSLAKRRGGFGKVSGSKKLPTSNRDSTHTNTGHKSNQDSQGGYPKQRGQSNQGGYRPQSSTSRYPGSYPQQPGRGGYHKHYPAQGSPYGGGYGSYGGYPGGYINQNPNNRVLSPHYRGSFGYGGYGVGGGSPFYQSVQAMGMYPSHQSRGFGRSAVMAAAGGAMAGMALGYGLGRFPRPHFHFHNPQEEHYYNHYMYRKYGTKSTDTNDYSRDYSYTQPPETYDRYMDSCMKRADLLPAKNRKPNNEPAAITTTTVVTSASDTGTHSNTAETNSTASEHSSAPSTAHPPKQPEEESSQDLSSAEGDDTVSIVEIGYPALIEQLKARRCLELYMVYSEEYLRQAGGAQRNQMGLHGLLAAVVSIVLMLLNSNMLMLLH
uniref:Prion protein, related sequence 3 n=1 Tax=Monopterus albus TaxID=43700 RepID=A0A3Q3KHJ4_MONAL|nr:eukaryotic peptide chain release factor GTP-binding subunit-like [Monopterus albus]